jgi:hypothetical protein
MLAGSTVPVTFDPPLASGRPNVELLHPRHPLANAAVTYWQEQEQLSDADDNARLVVEAPDLMPGVYDFFIFKLEISAVTPSVTFETVALKADGGEAEDVSRSLLRLVIGATDSEDGVVDEAHLRTQRARAEARASKILRTRQQEATSRNEALLSLRREAIVRAEDAKIRRAEEVVRLVSNPRIVRMKVREIENVEAAKRARLGALEAKRQVLVSIEEVAAGRLEIVPPVSRSSSMSDHAASFSAGLDH